MEQIAVMSELSRRSTIYFTPDIHHAVRCKAESIGLSFSQVLNEAIRSAFSEDDEDLTAFEERASEATITLDELLEDLGAHDRL